MSRHQGPGIFSLATDRSVVRRAALVASVVGTVLALINHGDRIFAGSVDGTVLLKICVTFAVPYCVSTYSSVLAIRDRLQVLEPMDET